MFKKLKIDSFVIAILISILIAYFFPQLGAKDSPIPMNTVGSIGISLIFFFYGLSLSSDAIRNGLKNWKLHVLVQSTTFLIFPLIILAFHPLFKEGPHELLWLAFLFMAALPRGNLPAAIFNASISGIIGIIVTPLWMIPYVKPFVSDPNISFDFSSIYLQLITEIVVPLTLGLMLRKFFGIWAIKNKKSLDRFDKFIILLIIYKSFVHSFEEKIFSSVSLIQLAIMGLIVAVIFFVTFNLTSWLGKLLGFNYEDQITNQFCGTKKSLVHGTVFSEALFAGTGLIGILLLPLMFYHAIQILIISIYASRLAARFKEEK